jgi:hypothetical protein
MHLGARGGEWDDNTNLIPSESMLTWTRKAHSRVLAAATAFVFHLPPRKARFFLDDRFALINRSQICSDSRLTHIRELLGRHYHVTRVEFPMQTAITLSFAVSLSSSSPLTHHFYPLQLVSSVT